MLPMILETGGRWGDIGLAWMRRVYADLPQATWQRALARVAATLQAANAAAILSTAGGEIGADSKMPTGYQVPRAEQEEEGDD